MTNHMTIALAGVFAVAANMAFSENKQADVTAQYSDTDTYEIIDWSGGNMYSQGRLIPCEVDDQDKIQCTGPEFPQNIYAISALLYNQDHGGLVQCQFVKTETEAGHEDVFAQYDPQLFIRVTQQTAHDYPLNVADMLRPSQGGVKDGVAEFGSCVPYETPLTDAQMNDIRDDTLHVPKKQYVLGDAGVDWPGPGRAFGAGIAFKDWEREDRLYVEYSRVHNGGSDILRVVEEDFWGDGSQIDYYIHANAPACDNTGDFSMADRIKDAVRNNTTVSGIRLRANCPAP